MKLSLFACALVAVLIASTSHAQARAVPPGTVEQIRTAGTVGALTQLQGRLVAHQGGRRFVFSDGSGELSAEIAPGRFPADRFITADQRVEVVGAVEREALGLRLDVQRLRVLP